MRLFFLIPLVTGILSSYICLNSKDDITYIFGVIAGGSFILSLILSPWEVQLLILLLVIVNLRQFWLKTVTSPDENLDDLNNNHELNFNCDNQSKNHQKNKALIVTSPQQFALNPISAFLDHKSKSSEVNNSENKTPDPQTIVKYRGVELQPQENLSALDTVENNEVIGKYRGLPLKSHSFSQDLKLKKKTDIKYRGIPLESD